MSLSRRSFVQTLGAGAAGAWIAARGREASLFAQGIQPLAGPAPSIILSSNENPLGCHKDVLAAIQNAAFPEAGRYPNASIFEVMELIARKHNVKPENVLLGSGSTQILRSVTHAFTSPSKPLLLSAASYEECPAMARTMGTPVEYVPMTGDMKADLGAIAAKAKGASATSPPIA